MDSFDEATMKDERKEDTKKGTWLHAVDMSYELEGEWLLRDVNAEFAPCTLTVVLGTSGKTLVNVLGGRTPEWKGDIQVNGEQVSRKKLRSTIAYAPKDDVALYKQLTLRQMLVYSALLRLEGTHEEKIGKVDEVMALLGLTSVAEKVFGDVGKAERKAASAAVEILSTRQVLIFDEPTAGLSKVEATTLLKNLRTVAQLENRTIIAHVDHATVCDKVLVLATVDACGTIAYDGPLASLPDHCSAGGSPVPSRKHPADHVLDLVTKDPTLWINFWSASEVRKNNLLQMSQRLSDLAGDGHDDIDIDDDDIDEPLPAVATAPPLCGRGRDGLREMRRRFQTAKDILNNFSSLV